MADKSMGKLSKYILKNSKNKDKNLKYDFMPSLLEIIERPTHVAGKIIVVAIASLLVIALIWAYFSEIDVVVTGSGYIVTEADMGTVTSQTSGVVNKFYVSEGDYVHSGDVLMELDTSKIDLEIKRIETELDLLEVQRDIIVKYLANVNAKISPEDYDEAYQYIVNEFIYANKIYRLQEEQTTLGKELIKTQYQSSLNEQLLAVEEKLRVYGVELEAQRLMLDKMVLKAPANGYILSSAVSYEGQVVTSYEELFVITPDESGYIFEGYISDKDIADISIGDAVQLKLQSYSFSDYGAVEGCLTYISPSTVNMEGAGNVYMVQVEIDAQLMNENINLMSGLSGTMEIKVGQRSVLEYFLDPIIGNINESLNEK